MTDKDFDAFKQYIADKDYGYKTQSEEALEQLKKKAEDEKYFDAIKDTYTQLKQNLAHDKQADIDRSKDEVMVLLQEEIAKRYYFQKATYEATFKNDNDIQAAINIFKDPTRYQSMLKK
jgi:carboxyl-terminal processing protease